MNAVISQDFEAANDALDTTAADDFTVPPGESWTIDRVDVMGIYGPPGGPAASSRVRFYEASGTLPGASVFTSISMPADGGVSPNFALPVSGVPALPSGHYWVSVQAIKDSGLGLWLWTTRAEQSGDPAVVENPGDGLATGCTTFMPLADCGRPDEDGGADMVFSLNGRVGPPPDGTDTSITLSLDARRRQPVKKLTVTVDCGEEACNAKLRGKAVAKKKRKGGKRNRASAAKKRGKKTLKVKPKTFSVPPGEKKTKRVKFKKNKKTRRKVRRLLKRGAYRAKAKLNVTANDDAGNEARERATVKLMR